MIKCWICIQRDRVSSRCVSRENEAAAAKPEAMQTCFLPALCPSGKTACHFKACNSIFPGDTHLSSVSVWEWGWGQRRNEIKKAKLAAREETARCHLLAKRRKDQETGEGQVQNNPPNKCSSSNARQDQLFSH